MVIYIITLRPSIPPFIRPTFPLFLCHIFALPPLRPSVSPCVTCASVCRSDLPDVYDGHHDPVNGPHCARPQPSLHQRLPRAPLAQHHRSAIHRQGALHVPNSALQRITSEPLRDDDGESAIGASAAVENRRRRGGDGWADDPTETARGASGARRPEEGRKTDRSRTGAGLQQGLEETRGRRWQTLLLVVSSCHHCVDADSFPAANVTMTSRHLADTNHIWCGHLCDLRQTVAVHKSTTCILSEGRKRSTLRPDRTPRDRHLDKKMSFARAHVSVQMLLTWRASVCSLRELTTFECDHQLYLKGLFVDTFPAHI